MDQAPQSDDDQMKTSSQKAEAKANVKPPATPDEKRESTERYPRTTLRDLEYLKKEYEFQAAGRQRRFSWKKASGTPHRTRARKDAAAANEAQPSSSAFSREERPSDKATGTEGKNEAEAYAALMRQKSTLKRNGKIIAWSAVLTVVLLFVFTILPTGIFVQGSSPLALFISGTADNIVSFANWITGGPVTSGISIVFWQMFAAAVVGAALSLSGAVYQSTLKNALASPSTLGVTSGGTFGALVYTLTLGVPESVGAVQIVRASELQQSSANMDIVQYLLSTQGRALFSIAGCFIIVGLILVIAHIAGRGKVSKVALLIAGQVFAAIIAGLTSIFRSYLQFYGTVEQQEALQYITGGSITMITGPLTFSLIAIPFAIGAVIIMLLRYRMNILAFSPEEAHAMGVSQTATRNIVIIVCTALTGVVVSFVGAVGFIGFIVPHIARKIVGPDLRYLIPASMLFGAIFLMFANYLMNMTGILQGALGTFTSLVGAIFFLIIVIRERSRNNVEWV